MPLTLLGEATELVDHDPQRAVAGVADVAGHELVGQARTGRRAHVRRAHVLGVGRAGLGRVAKLHVLPGPQLLRDAGLKPCHGRAVLAVELRQAGELVKLQTVPLIGQLPRDEHGKEVGQLLPVQHHVFEVHGVAQADEHGCQH